MVPLWLQFCLLTICWQNGFCSELVSILVTLVVTSLEFPHHHTTTCWASWLKVSDLFLVLRISIFFWNRGMQKQLLCTIAMLGFLFDVTTKSFGCAPCEKRQHNEWYTASCFMDCSRNNLVHLLAIGYAFSIIWVSKIFAEFYDKGFAHHGMLHNFVTVTLKTFFVFMWYLLKITQQQKYLDTCMPGIFKQVDLFVPNVPSSKCQQKKMEKQCLRNVLIWLMMVGGSLLITLFMWMPQGETKTKTYNHQIL